MGVTHDKKETDPPTTDREKKSECKSIPPDSQRGEKNGVGEVRTKVVKTLACEIVPGRGKGGVTETLTGVKRN